MEGRVHAWNQGDFVAERKYRAWTAIAGTMGNPIYGCIRLQT